MASLGLCKASASGDTSQMAHYIESGANLHTQVYIDNLQIRVHAFGDVPSSFCGALTALQWAVVCRQENAVELLLREGANPHEIDRVRRAV